MAIKRYVVRDEQQLPIGAGVDFGNGTKIEVLFADLTEAICLEGMANGFKQKLGDGAAKSAGTPLQEKIDEVQAIYDGLMDGEWNRKGEGDGGMLREALIALAKRAKRANPEAAVDDLLASTDKEGRKALLKRADVKAKVKEIQAERAKKAAAHSTDEKPLFG